MRFFAWILRLALFVLLLGFAIKNDGVVTVRFFFDSSWNLPLVVVMLGFFVLGSLFGATAAVVTLLSQRREIGRLRKEQDAATPTSAVQRMRTAGGDLPESY